MEYSDKEFIKLYRRMLSNTTIMKDADHLAMWTYLLLTVAWKECYAEFGGIKIKINAGQFVYGRKAIASKLGCSESKTQRVLKRFQDEHMIEQRMSSRNRLITILNWGSYQMYEQHNEQQMNNKRTTDEQQMNTKEEDKNLRSNNNTYKEDTHIDEIVSMNPKKQTKKSYGEFKNVKLSDDEYQKVLSGVLLHYIDRLDAYIESTGKRYKSHYATILNWNRSDIGKPVNKRSEEMPDYKSDEKPMNENELKDLKERLKNLGKK